MSIFEKLSAVQSDLKAPKSQYNSFGKYNYRNCEDIIEAAKPLLKANGLLLSITDDIVLMGERFYVKATASVIDVTDGKTHSVTAFAREEKEKRGMDGSQVTGASSSYARKYALNGLFGIDDTKDSDATNTGTTKEVQMESVADAAGYVITFGKNKGKTLGELYKTDRKYLEWLDGSQYTDPIIKKGIAILVQAAIASRQVKQDA
jgi:hypothetical protein